VKRILILVFFTSVFALWQSAACAQTAASWIERGESLEQHKVYDEAVKAYTKAIELDPGAAKAYLKRGTARFAAKKTNCTEALDDLSEAIRLAPRNAEAYYQRGIVNYYLINNEQGRRDMEAAAALGHAGAREWLEKADKQGAVSADTAILSTPAIAVVHFDHNSADITASYRALLAETVKGMGDTSSSIMVSGHADSTGTNEYNRNLSMNRAAAVKEYLVEHGGVSSERITVRAYGEEMPIASNDTDEGRASNRRVEISKD